MVVARSAFARGLHRGGQPRERVGHEVVRRDGELADLVLVGRLEGDRQDVADVLGVVGELGAADRGDAVEVGHHITPTATAAT